MPIYSVDPLNRPGRQVPRMEVAATTRKENFVALGMEKCGCGEWSVLDVNGSKERIWCWMCRGSNMMEEESRCWTG
jgi:hypothetical protein